MGEYIDIANRISGELRERREETRRKESNDKREMPHGGRQPEKIRPRDIPDLIGEVPGVGNSYNFYPGIKDVGCCQVAFFISLKSPVYSSGGHITCEKAMKTIVQHMGKCGHITKELVFITDDWNVAAFAEWETSLRNIISINNAKLEIYLLVNDHPLEINI